MELNMKKLSLNHVKEEFFKTVKDEYQILDDEYYGSKKKLKIIHNICKNIILMSRDGFILRKNRCKFCSPYRSFKFTNEEFKKRVLNSKFGVEYEVLDDYVNTHKKMKFKHLVCGKYFEMSGNNFLIKENRCPNCARSKGEEKISFWLKENNFHFEQQAKERGLGNLKFDFKVFIDNSYILLEYDGRFHFEPFSKNPKHVKEFEKHKKRDETKEKHCKKFGIKLVRISYIEIDNLYLILENTFNDYRNHIYSLDGRK
jgi:hypothetical protein